MTLENRFFGGRRGAEISCGGPREWPPYASEIEHAWNVHLTFIILPGADRIIALEPAGGCRCRRGLSCCTVDVARAE